MKRWAMFVLFFWVSVSANSAIPALFFKQHHLLFFFASSCSYCHQAAPILKTWGQDHDASIEAYSLNAQGLPEFPEPYHMNPELLQAAFQDRPVQYPALFILNLQTKALYSVAVGFLTAVELDTRLQNLIPKVLKYEGALS